MSSINTGTVNFDGHLKSKDFFNVEQFATAKFVGDKFEFDGTKVKSVSGNLTMLGKTSPVTLTAEHYNCFMHPRLKVEVCGGDFVTTIQRSQWGMAYAIPGIPDSVRLVIQVEAIKQP
jgi:polyisoprenoid-binding protein YceI